MKNPIFTKLPRTAVATDPDVEALRRTLSQPLEINADGTVTERGTKKTRARTPQGRADAAKKKLGDVPGGVLGVDLQELLEGSQTVEKETTDTEPAPEKKKLGTVPKGVLGASLQELLEGSEAEPTPADESAPAAEKKKLGTVPKGVLGISLQEMLNNPPPAAETTIVSDSAAETEPAPEKKKLGTVPKGVLGGENDDLVSEFRTEPAVPAEPAPEQKKLGDVPSGVLGAAVQWYAKPENAGLLQMERQAMLPIVGEIKWGVNCGTLDDGRMYWRIRQPIKHLRADGTYLFNNLYDILLVYEPTHPKSQWGTSIHAYLMAPHDLTWLQRRVNESPRTPKNIPHVLTDGNGQKYLCISHYNDFGTDYKDPRGVATAKTALMDTIKWLFNAECALLDQTHWEKFQEHGKI